MNERYKTWWLCLQNLRLRGIPLENPIRKMTRVIFRRLILPLKNEARQNNEARSLKTEMKRRRLFERR